MNKWIGIGRLCADPTLKFTPNGAAVCNFTLAVNRRKVEGQEQEVDFINIVVWNKQGENAAKYLTKGRQAAVEGRLQIRSYDGNDGQKRWATEVIADSVEYIGSNGNSANSSATDSGYGDLGTEIVFNDNDIPF